MSVQVVLYKTNTLYHRIIFFNKFLHNKSIVDCGASRSHLHTPPASQGCESEQNTAGTMTLIFVILTVRSARFPRYRDKSLTHAWTGPFLTADYRTQRIVRVFVQRKKVFPVPNRGTSAFAYAPALDYPRVKFIFFRLVLTVSMEMEATAFHSMS